MPACKITVIKKTFNEEIAKEYRRADVHFGPCPFCEVGDTYLVQGAGYRPDDFFCDWAWNDIQKIVMAVTTGGDFSRWMKDGKTFITCCTDGVKPVIFKLERVENTSL